MRRLVAVTSALVLSSSIAYAVQTHWMGMIKGKDGAAIGGMAMMMGGKSSGTTDVTVELTGDTPSTTRPWHIHTGTCATGGGVFGGGKAYTPLSVDEKGTASSKATLAVAVPDTGHFYVNIHESAANMSKIVACGDLAR